MSANHHRSRMMFQCSSPFTSSFPPRFWKDVLISIGYKYGKMAPTDKNRWEKKKRAAAADDHPDRIGPHRSFRRTLHEPIDIDLCSSFSFHRLHRKRKRERNIHFWKRRDAMRWITTRDDENENNNEPFFIPIARTFTVDRLFEDDREDLEETFFEMIDGDDRTALKEEANMMSDVA